MAPNTSSRILGFDIARAFAVFGMVIVNFKIAMEAQTGAAFWLGFASLFEGRASALFVILAGLGISLMTKKVRLEPHKPQIREAQVQLLKRALALFVIGLAYTPIWPADILHFYGVYFAIAAMLCFCSDRTVLLSCVGFVLGFVALLLVFDYDQGWDWASLTYTDLWTWQGLLRHMIFNGFHPVFPWAAFLLFGMWLGRKPLTDPVVQQRYAIISLAILIFTELSLLGLRVLGEQHFSMPVETINTLLTSNIIPPLPQYMLSAGSSAVFILMLCLGLGQRYSHLWLIRSLYRTGQLSLTLYIAHVFIGMGLLEAFNLLSGQSIEIALQSALIYCLSALVFSVIWLRFFTLGPCEWMFKKITR
ncbi:DUF418 domain-containing protein [Pseudoalteromonas ulvae]|uniref:DUF418 domain-containing protein n=1 Tax=Pseudoalteromonas ulvae TaxID=107327 RepID=UPI00186B7C17|nr:heparan-alpha-glucosaminide N-acetyltransferase domain-containing protein [Pseudoalteromonas ulvae]